MLHPQQFEVNEAWIAFRLNGVPVRTEQDGEFHCIALMDAASCFILGSEFIPVTSTEPTEAQFRRLLNHAKSHKQQLPKTLLISRGELADRITLVATQHNIEVVQVLGSQLDVFVGEARQVFAERFE